MTDVLDELREAAAKAKLDGDDMEAVEGILTLAESIGKTMGAHRSALDSHSNMFVAHEARLDKIEKLLKSENSRLDALYAICKDIELEATQGLDDSKALKERVTKLQERADKLLGESRDDSAQSP